MTFRFHQIDLFVSKVSQNGLKRGKKRHFRVLLEKIFEVADCADKTPHKKLHINEPSQLDSCKIARNRVNSLHCFFTLEENL